MLAWELPLLAQPAYVGYEFVALPDMLASLLANYTLGVLQRPEWWNVIPAIGLLAGAVLVGARQSRPASVLFVTGWLVVPVMLFFLVTLSRPMYTPRYLIFVLPPLLLLLALGGVLILRRSRLLGMVLIGTILLFSGRGLWIQLRTPLKSDFRGATHFFVQRWDASDLVLFQIPHARHSFEYYLKRGTAVARRESGAVPPTLSTGANSVYLPYVAVDGTVRYRWAEGLYTNSGMSSEDASLRMAETVGNSRVVWLIESEASLWDRRGLVKRWLEEYAVLTDTGEFVSVTVYRYEVE
jgi:hypothetical protein